jgi:hypothetical protein
LAAIAELSGYNLRDLINPPKPSIQQETQGDQSPAVIGDDVQLNYSNDWEKEDAPEKKDSTQKQ